MNIDKDIEIVKGIKRTSLTGGFDKQTIRLNAISNVLTQLNTNKYDINNYEERITSLKSELETYKEEFKKINKALSLEEGIVEPYTTDIIEGLKRCVTQQHKELETYKKIAEKLAEYIAEKSNFCANKCCMNEECHDNDCIIDWARKEVEKEC